ncbi:MAG: alpha/beta hydrolase family esterase, partial [Flavobacteriales bacterium]
HPDVFSAVGSVTGAMSTEDFGCTPEEVVSVIHLHGTSDATVPYEGGTGGPWGLESVPAIVDHWTGLMGTTTLEETALPNQEVVDVTSVDLLRYAGAPGGQEFHHYRVNGGGHEWFGAWGSPDVDATAVLWDFFSAQCAGEFTDVPVLEDAAKWVDVTADGVRSRQPCVVEAFNVLGQRSASFRLDAGESWRPMDAGMTVLRITGEDGRVRTVKWTR